MAAPVADAEDKEGRGSRGEEQQGEDRGRKRERKRAQRCEGERGRGGVGEPERLLDPVRIEVGSRGGLRQGPRRRIRRDPVDDVASALPELMEVERGVIADRQPQHDRRRDDRRHPQERDCEHLPQRAKQPFLAWTGRAFEATRAPHDFHCRILPRPSTRLRPQKVRWDQPFAQYNRGTARRKKSTTRACCGRPNKHLQGRKGMINLFDHLVARLHREDEGQTLVEYALILAFVSVLSIGALTRAEHQINAVFAAVSTRSRRQCRECCSGFARDVGSRRSRGRIRAAPNQRSRSDVSQL